ncbi:DUF4097 family beta strand repeat-containing protein [Streptomyces sp. CB03911]|uniref:DUF4097 family beta strand repeat-containing protein n=1 Tax=Streptomyces sp. CB03911 TaxID=1804758 RepID=UPI00093BF4CF|nr:DUF4097 family beta strand repeat-containing protein [Streptomyces sp. CB03911]OKI19928.1 hypothetical protein A6A07_38105 [Streptomyces sp. CB03911]
MLKFDTPAPVTAILDIPAGRIRFIAADRTDTTVEVLAADPGKNRDVKAAGQVTVTYTDGALHIEAAPAKNRIVGNSGSVEVTVQLPAGSHVRAKSAAGELRGVGRLGDVTYEAAQGTVKLDESASAHLTLQAGDLTLHRLTGPATITTLKGDITVTEARHGTLDLRTTAGHITVGTARGTRTTLDAATSLGRIHNALTSTPDGPQVTIHATTTHGDITARTL